MITIGTVRFDFRTGNESFAYALYGHWDTFFHTSFENVVEEVLSVYDQPDYAITIDSLPFDLGAIEEEYFEKQFPLRLREALDKFCREKLDESQVFSAENKGIRVVSTGRNAFDLLSFFLLHGYFPFTTNAQDIDLSMLLEKVIAEESYRFREFLNSYGHYDSLCNRLVFQFTDDELEKIINVVQPSESKFINLYVRVQIHTYDSFRHTEVTYDNYRNIIWILVFAYLFVESGGYLNRKQIILYTIRGLAAHLNLTLPEMVLILTESIRELEQRVEQLPELWSILKEIREDLKEDVWALDGDFRIYLVKEIVLALRSIDETSVENIFSRAHLINVLSSETTCRRLLQQLREKEIYSLVAFIIPQEKEYVISYACMLDRHKDIGSFSGKAGSEFYLLKWEFIFAILIALPASTFNRKQFVLSVLQQLAAHYNFAVKELVSLLCADGEINNATIFSGLRPVLQELNRIFLFGKGDKKLEEYSTEEWLTILQTPSLAYHYIEKHTESQRIALAKRLFPAYSNFIIDYAVLLDKGYEVGMMRGKAGSEFAVLKWKFIFSCFLPNNFVAFHQKRFVYMVLQQLAAHYNQDIIELIDYFWHHLPEKLIGNSLNDLKCILKELHCETALVMTSDSIMRSKSNAELEYLILDLFGHDSILSFQSNEKYLEKWLIFLLNERNQLFRSLWKSGKLNATVLLKVVNQVATLRSLWLHKIGDERLRAIYRDWSAVYVTLRSRFGGLGYLEQLGEYITVWMVELTINIFSSWSEKEIISFLTKRIRQSIPPGFMALLKETSQTMDRDRNRNVIEIIKNINELKEEGIIMEQVSIKNAGLVILGNYIPMLFRAVDYLDSDRKDFKDEESKIRAIFLLQYIAYGKQMEFNENELYLNKLLVNIPGNVSLPRSCELTENEMRFADSLTVAIKNVWSKMEHTSIEAIRLSFFIREAIIYTKDEMHAKWLMEVKERAYDVLLDTYPMMFRIINFPWMDGALEVHWRK